MTKQDAIKTLHELWRETNDSWYQETYNTAISALEKQDNPDTNDLISRQVAAEHFKKRLYETALNSDTDYLCYEEIADNRVDVWMNEVPSAQPEQRWIPIAERPPEEETDVLVTRKFLGCKDGSHGWNNHIPATAYVEVAQYFCGEWTALSDEYKVARSKHTDPIAWMPLPEPYKEEEE